MEDFPPITVEILQAEGSYIAIDSNREHLLDIPQLFLGQGGFMCKIDFDRRRNLQAQRFSMPCFSAALCRSGDRR